MGDVFDFVTGVALGVALVQGRSGRLEQDRRRAQGRAEGLDRRECIRTLDGDSVKIHSLDSTVESRCD